MATINGYTAERMKAIEDAAIVSGAVVGDDLILKKHDGTEVNAGMVKGAQGEPGLSDVTALLAAQALLLDPPGVPKPYTGATAPSGHGLCDAATEYLGSTYPLLAALYGTGSGCVNGSSASGKFRLPNLKGRALVGLDATITAFDTLHKIGGSKDAVNVSHAHNHNHGHNHEGTSDIGGVNHVHDIDSNGSHDHTASDGAVFAVSIGGPQNDRLAQTSSTSETGAYITYDSVDDAGAHVHTMSNASAIDHTHSFTTDSDSTSDSTSSGVAATDANLPPYRVVNYIMRLA